VQEQEEEVAREVERTRQEVDAARARQIAEIEAQLAEQLDQAKQEMEAARQQRDAEQAEAERRVREAAKAAEAAGSSHLTSWQQAEVERQLNSRVYIADPSLQRTDVFDGTSGQLGVIGLTGSTSIAVNSTSGRVYILNSGTNVLTMVQDG
jgi:hypothetical protein